MLVYSAPYFPRPSRDLSIASSNSLAWTNSICPFYSYLNVLCTYSPRKLFLSLPESHANHSPFFWAFIFYPSSLKLSPYFSSPISFLHLFSFSPSHSSLQPFSLLFLPVSSSLIGFHPSISLSHSIRNFKPFLLFVSLSSSSWLDCWFLLLFLPLYTHTTALSSPFPPPYFTTLLYPPTSYGCWLPP